MFYLTQTGVGFTQDEKLPSDAVVCTEEQATSGKYRLVNGKVIVIDTTEVDNAVKKRLAANQCKTTLLSGFLSSALGELHKYPSSEDDQRNLIAFVTSGINASLWCATGDNWALTEHTPDQLKQVLADWHTFLQTEQTKLAKIYDNIDKGLL